jgi:hypothetical protein
MPPTSKGFDALAFAPGLHDKLIEFEYMNWRDNLHTYVVQPEGVAIGTYDPGGHSSDPADSTFVLHGTVVTRDADTRPEMGDNRRRTFIIQKIVGAVRVLEPSR